MLGRFSLGSKGCSFQRGVRGGRVRANWGLRPTDLRRIGCRGPVGLAGAAETCVPRSSWGLGAVWRDFGPWERGLFGEKAENRKLGGLEMHLKFRKSFHFRASLRCIHVLGRVVAGCAKREGPCAGPGARRRLAPLHASRGSLSGNLEIAPRAAGPLPGKTQRGPTGVLTGGCSGTRGFARTLQ